MTTRLSQVQKMQTISNMELEACSEQRTEQQVQQQTKQNRARHPRRWELAPILVGLVLMGWTTLAGAAERVTEEREVSGFHALSAAISGDFRLERGKTESLTIRASAETLELIRTEVVDGELRVFQEGGRWWHETGPIEVLIIYRELDRLDLSGSAEVETDALTGSMFEVQISGSSDVQVPDMQVEVLGVSVSGSGNLNVDRLTVDEVRIEVTGSGDVTLAGNADQQTVTVRGSGTVNNADLESVETSAVVSGSGDATVWASRTLVARISGSGDIEYRGDPEVRSEVTGSGGIRGY